MIKFNPLEKQFNSSMPEIMGSIERVLSGGQYIMGENVAMFEGEFANASGAKFCSSVASGTDALILALTAAGIGEGDSVIVPSNTYIATWLAVSNVGARVIPVEPGNDYCIDVDQIEGSILPDTKAIMPVHLFGIPCDMFRIIKIAQRHGLMVISDCAQAHGAKYLQRDVGSFADINCYSFYPTKNLGAVGDAGAVLSDLPDIIKKVNALRRYGETQKNLNAYIGANSRMDEIQAAILRVKLNFLSGTNERRRAYASVYVDKLSGVGDLIFPEINENQEPVYHQFVIRTEHRDELREHLRDHGIPTMVHYPVPPHMQPVYATQFDRDEFPIASKMAETMISLPIDPYHSYKTIGNAAFVIRGYFDDFNNNHGSG